MIPASIVQMLGGTIIVYSSLLSVFYLKKELFRYHILSIVMIMTGVFLVGLSFYL